MNYRSFFVDLDTSILFLSSSLSFSFSNQLFFFSLFIAKLEAQKAALASTQAARADNEQKLAAQKIAVQESTAAVMKAKAATEALLRYFYLLLFLSLCCANKISNVCAQCRAGTQGRRCGARGRGGRLQEEVRRSAGTTHNMCFWVYLKGVV